MSINKSGMYHALSLSIVLVGVSLIAVGCVARDYTASDSSMRVLPSKGWRKSGATGEEAYHARGQCTHAAQVHPKYLELKLDANDIKIERNMSREDERRLRASGKFSRSYVDACMENKGFVYGNLPDRYIYIPPPPPKKGWMKSGVSYEDASFAMSRCLRQEYSQAYLDKCMAEQGFTYGVLGD